MSARFLAVAALSLASAALPAARADAAIKAAYFYSYMTTDHIDRLADVGFNRAIVRNIGDSLTQIRQAEIEAFIDRGRLMGIDVVPSWALQAPERLRAIASTRRYTWGTGVVEAGVGCPADSLFWNSVLRDRALETLRALPGQKRLHVDLEIYTGSRTHYNAGPCRCATCVREYSTVAGRLGAPTMEVFQENRTTSILTGILRTISNTYPGTEISFFDLDLNFPVHRAMVRALVATATPTGNYTERSYTIAGEAIPTARQALDRLGLQAPLVGGLIFRRHTPATLPGAIRSVLDLAEGCFMFTTFSLWEDPARLTGPYVLLGTQAEYWTALRTAFGAPDLYPTSVRVTPDPILQGSAAEFRFVAKNRGQTAAPESRWTLSVGTTMLAEGMITVPVRDSVVVTRLLGPELSAGTYPLTVTLDAGGVVDENREDNNVLTRSLVIKPTRPPTEPTFPASPVLDSFNRPNGLPGGPWTGNLTGLAVSSYRLKTNSAAYAAAIWDGVMGPDQEAYVRFVDVTRARARQGLLLKVQGRTVETGAIQVSYDYTVKRVVVSTYTPGRGWEARGAGFPATITDEDVLGARARADGTVTAYRNGAPLGTLSLGTWPYAAREGRLGVTLEEAVLTRFDDFGGGSWGGTTGTSNRAPVASATGTPTTGAAPLVVSFSSLGTIDPDGDAHTFAWSFGDGTGSIEPNPVHSYGPGLWNAVLTVTDARGAATRDTVVIRAFLDAGFPATPIVDNFNRTSGLPIGPSWAGTVATAVISSQKLKSVDSAYVAVAWKNAEMGPDQEAYVRFVDVTRLRPNARQGLLLKVQGTVEGGALEVRYDYTLKKVIVSTFTPGSGWVERGSGFTARITDEDTLGARAYADGTVEVYRNTIKLGTVSVARWAYAARGGRIGLTLERAPSTRFDDFGGGTLTAPRTLPASAVKAPVEAGARETPSPLDAAPVAVELARPVPNPTAGVTLVRFGLPADGHARVSVHDVQGRRVATLADGPFRAGWHTARWDGRALHGGPAAAGVYMLGIEAGGTSRVRKVVLTR